MDDKRKYDTGQDLCYPVEEEEFFYQIGMYGDDFLEDFELPDSDSSITFDLNHQSQSTTLKANNVLEEVSNKLEKSNLSVPISENGPLSNNFEDVSNSHATKKKKRKESEKVQLTASGTTFRKRFYRFLTHGMKKIARKELILKYHGMICQRYSFIRNVQRDEYRSIKKYFNKHADQELYILKALQELKNEGLLNYEEDLRSLTSINDRSLDYF
ncbi:hypothetical protein M9Y10_035410 [Tritrichomonas musculus]|uniref:Uncharacterized protein n=1 Tax=Tritrichomonas musculus TaxID=1915356 RepID=A0ABR2KHT8_9EUKA